MRKISDKSKNGGNISAVLFFSDRQPHGKPITQSLEDKLLAKYPLKYCDFNSVAVICLGSNFDFALFLVR
jgi:hypothetical protein